MGNTESVSGSTGSENTGSDSSDSESLDSGEGFDTEGGDSLTQDGGTSKLDKNPAQGKTKQQMMKELTEDQLDAMVTTKVDGKVVKKSVRDLIKADQLEQASHARMKEAAEIKKHLKMQQQREQQLNHLMKTDFAKFCQVTGLDPKQISIDFLAKQYDMEQMTPEQKELMELRQMKQETEKQKKEREEHEQQEKGRALENQQAQVIDRDIGEALKTSNLPKNKLFIQRTAVKMLENVKRMEAGLDDSPLQASEAVAKVKEDWISDVRDTINSLDAKAIHELLGPEALKKIRAHDIERVTGQRNEPSSDSRPPSGASGKQIPKAMNEFERREYMRNLKNNMSR